MVTSVAAEQEAPPAREPRGTILVQWIRAVAPPAPGVAPVALLTDLPGQRALQGPVAEQGQPVGERAVAVVAATDTPTPQQSWKLRVTADAVALNSERTVAVLVTWNRATVGTSLAYGARSTCMCACLTCKDRRVIPCKRCHPRLRVKTGTVVPPGAVDCPDCKGKGEVSCPDCEGIGFFI